MRQVTSPGDNAVGEHDDAVQGTAAERFQHTRHRLPQAARLAHWDDVEYLIEHLPAALGIRQFGDARGLTRRSIEMNPHAEIFDQRPQPIAVGRGEQSFDQHQTVRGWKAAKSIYNED